MSHLRPAALKPGSHVRVIAPAGPFDRESFDAGLKLLSGRYDARYREDLFSGDRYLAGSDDRRLEELTQALTDDSAGVFCARGGYGAMRILGKVPWEKIRSKALVGFSDITALHLAMQKYGHVSFHAPVLTQLGRQPAEVLQRLFKLLEKDAPIDPLAGDRCIVPGKVEGRLIGGNMSVFTRMIGSSFMPELSGAVLLLEDVGERPYRLDRMWMHMELAGIFHRVSGIVLGDFTNCEEKGASYSHLDILTELAKRTGLPCASGFRIGHGDVNQPVPLGVHVRLDADNAKLEFLESAVRS
ncbi:MAG: LD-carboxypeptidase [Myxococcaceae bacterium]